MIFVLKTGMKTLVLVFIVLWTSSLKANDGKWFGPEPDSEKFFLVSAAIDNAHRHMPEEPESGLLMMSDRFVEVLIKMEFKCEPGFYCPAAIPSPLYIKLPVTSVQETGCGLITIAERDMRMSGGIYEKLRVVDYRNVLCKIFVENMLHSEYTTEGTDPVEGDPFTHVSSFEFSTKF